MANIYKLGLFFAMVLLLPLQAQAWDLSGVWNGNPGGTFYIMQHGNDIWWYGEQSPNNPGWTNVAHGSIFGNQINLEWSDVPKGNSSVYGTLVVDIISNNELRKQKDNSIGGVPFGVNSWTRQGIKQALSIEVAKEIRFAGGI